jgi:hypothetical protein
VSEAATQDAIRLAAHSLGIVVWRNNVGLASDGHRKIRFGLAVGSSDLIGLLVPEGRFVALEVKSATGRATPEQERFLDLVRRSGGFAAVVRTVDEARAAVERARRGASQ